MWATESYLKFCLDIVVDLIITTSITKVTIIFGLGICHLM